MSTLFQRIKEFFSLKGSISRDLESYIASKNPKSINDVERLTQLYMLGGICGRTL